MLTLDLAGGRDRLAVLAIGAHADDIELGCGGTLLRLAREVKELELTWVVLSAAGARFEEAKAGAQAFGATTVEIRDFEDVADSTLWINGGFFVFDRRVFDYVQEGDDMPEILGRLIADRELLAIKYDGFWSPMDTLKDRERLEGLVRDGRSNWQVWAPARAC